IGIRTPRSGWIQPRQIRAGSAAEIRRFALEWAICGLTEPRRHARGIRAFGGRARTRGRGTIRCDTRSSWGGGESSMARLIVGREAEVTVLHAIVTDPEPDPRAVLIEGDPGIGKTTLLRELTSLARDHGLTVLGCRPTRTETDLSYAGLVELL